MGDLNEHRTIAWTCPFFPEQIGTPWAQWLSGKEAPAMPETQEVQVGSLGQEDPLEEDMATHSSILAWRIPIDRAA